MTTVDQLREEGWNATIIGAIAEIPGIAYILYVGFFIAQILADSTVAFLNPCCYVCNFCRSMLSQMLNT